MSLVLSAAYGHIASYPFKATGAAEGQAITGHSAAGHYLSVVEKGGEPAGSLRFGIEWAYRPASKGRMIAGFPEKAIAQFSSRRAQITKTLLALAEQYEKDRRHALDQQALANRGRFANAMPRRAKRPGALDFTALLRGWGRASRVAELETLRDLARTVWHSARHDGTDKDAPRHTRRTRAYFCAARVAQRTHARARTCGHGRRSRADARVTSRPLRGSAPASGNYRPSYTRARLEAR